MLVPFEALRLDAELLPSAICRWDFDVVHYQEMIPRTEGGEPVPGQLVVLVRRGGAESGARVAPRGDMGGVSKGSSEL